jgi:NitT/TauT family transport system permease protein
MFETAPGKGGPNHASDEVLVREAAFKAGRIHFGPLSLSRRRVVAALRVAVALALLGLWEFASGRWMDAFWLSSPSQVLERFGVWLADGSLLTNTAVTLLVIVAGISIGLLPGIVWGMALGSSRFLNRLLSPFIVFLYCIPLIALAPLLILWFGIGLTPKIVIVAAITLFLVFFNVYAGVSSQERDLGDHLRLMGGSNRDVALKVVLPGALPWLAAGLRIAVPYAVVGAVVGEMIVSTEGLGYVVKKSASTLDSTGVFTAIAALTALSVGLDECVSYAERRLLKWTPHVGRGESG